LFPLSESAKRFRSAKVKSHALSTLPVPEIDLSMTF